MKKIVFVNPYYDASVLQKVRVLALPPINLATLASLTADDYEVVLIDEAVEPFQLIPDADLVAITAMTPLAPRAYEIASMYRERGIPVVLGGIHASMMSEEAARHVDSIVLGEGEGVWPELVQDFEEGKLKKVYRGQRPDLMGQVAPRRELLQKDYFTQTVQTSRGCPFNCKFCSVTEFNGGKYRFRPVHDIISEVRQLDASRFFFIDDNIVGSSQEAIDRSLELFGELRHLNKVWGSQICVDIVERDEVLKAAADSHARFFFIGFESLESEVLSSMNKKINLRPGTRDFKEAIKKIHDHGIAVVGGFMFGNDCETKDIFERTVDFVVESRIDGAQFSIQTPFPGTRLYQQLKDENRLLYTDYPRDWTRYNGFEVVFEPKNMTVDELKEGQVWAYRQVASLGQSVLRAVRTLVTTKSLTGTAVAFCWNYDCYRSIAKSNTTFS